MVMWVGLIADLGIGVQVTAHQWVVVQVGTGDLLSES